MSTSPSQAEPALGILMLNTRFPRIPGDIGNPSSFPFPVRYEVIETATVDRVVTSTGPSAAVINGFVSAAARLTAGGVAGMTTSCGFMAIAQKELSARISVPVITSSLCQIPLVQSTLPIGKRVGVLTIDAAELSLSHFAGVGAPADLPIEGVENGRELARVIKQDQPSLDPVKAEEDVIKAGKKLLIKAPEVGAIVLECTNMAPYSKALAGALGLPVYDITGLLHWWYRSIQPPTFEKEAVEVSQST